jgi:hypothetical protein
VVIPFSRQEIIKGRRRGTDINRDITLPSCSSAQPELRECNASANFAPVPTPVTPSESSPDSLIARPPLILRRPAFRQVAAHFL